MQNLPIKVTPDGKTLIDDNGASVRCALNGTTKMPFSTS